jgi:hypothetical protein
MKEILTHEITEYIFMKYEHEKYDHAHEIANSIEDTIRRLPDRPGEAPPLSLYQEEKESAVDTKEYHKYDLPSILPEEREDARFPDVKFNPKIKPDNLFNEFVVPTTLPTESIEPKESISNTVMSDNEQVDRQHPNKSSFINIKNIDELLKFAEANYRIFCDLDGVLTGFDELFESFGHGTPDEFIDKHGEEAMWHFIMNKDPHFFYHEDWTSDGKELWNYVKQFNPTILTKITHIPKHCSEDKKKWVAEHLGKDVEIITTTKKDTYADENSILIDDMDKNTIPWEKAGGVAILHTSAKKTIKELEKYLNEK